LIEKLNPDRSQDGNLLGSGGYYIAYYFGDRVVVEFNEENRATYFFDKDYFDKLRVWHRSLILGTQPEGFHGRTIHKGDEDVWKSKVEEYITRPK
jgi:hypothetical protein